MAKINSWSPELDQILKKSAAFAQRYKHVAVSTPHLFLSMFQVVKTAGHSDERYMALYEKLKETFNKYGVNGPTFEKKFLEFSPKGPDYDEGNAPELMASDEIIKLKDNLMKKFLGEKRTMEVEDLVLELFSDPAYSVYNVIDAITGDTTATDRLYDEVQQIFKKVVAPVIESLEKIQELTNLNKFVMEKPQHVIAADDVVKQIELALSGRSIKNVILTGKAGTGKTTYVYEFVQRINSGNVPEEFKNKVVYQLDPAALIAGTRYRGDFEQKLSNILDIVRKEPNVILFVDEGHTIVKLGDNSDGANNAGNILKPYITRGEIQLIMCTTGEEYVEHILPQKAFARRFHEVKISEPTNAETVEILKGMLPIETKFFNKQIQEELLERVVTLSDKYNLDQANPAKSLNMLELACAYCKVFEENKETVDLDDVIQSIKLKYDIFISENKWEDTKEELFKQLLGQDDALNQVCRNLKIVDKNICDPDRPLFSMIFSGPTGTGKTEASKIIAKKFFGSEKALVKVNMGEFSAEMDVSKLAGSSAGYVGYDDEPAIVKGVRETPNCVVLFDEIEKAHPAVQKILLNILDTGEMVDNKGNRVSFRNTIIIFTTNLGCDKDTGKAVGTGLIKTIAGSTGDHFMKALENHFSPEFLGRIDDVVVFRQLSDEVAYKLIDRYVDFYNKTSELNITFTDADREEVVKNAQIKVRGARGLKAAVRRQFSKIETEMEEELFESSSF